MKKAGAKPAFQHVWRPAEGSNWMIWNNTHYASDVLFGKFSNCVNLAMARPWHFVVHRHRDHLQIFRLENQQHRLMVWIGFKSTRSLRVDQFLVNINSGIGEADQLSWRNCWDAFYRLPDTMDSRNSRLND
ncbi:hypothetical protein [Burkholderia sp. 22PA0106]|uniref:hypothetical protein n=1 Tax=Burkholderia sp. 22PA0106 TaxID=3237371 RepID=UPI0039C37A79